MLLQASTVYADLLRDMGIVDARQNNVRVLVRRLDATRERFRVGELTITDVSQAEARLEQAKADLVLAEAQVRIDQATFLRIVGARPGNLGELPLIGALPASEEECIALAMDYAPRAISAQQRITAASYGVNSAIAVLLPQVNLVGFVQYQQDLQVPTDQFTSTAYACRPPCRSTRTAANGRRSARPRSWSAAPQRARQRPPHGGPDGDLVLAQPQFGALARTSFTAQVRANDVALNGVRQEALVGSRTTLDVLNAEQELLNSQVNLISARHDVQVNYYGVWPASAA